MAPGSDAFPVQKVAPPAFELTQGQPHDGGQPIYFGSGAVLGSAGVTGYFTPPNPTYAATLAEDPGIHDHPHGADLARSGKAAVGDPHNQPLVYGSAGTIATLENRPQYGSGQVVATDPTLYILPPAHKLSSGNQPGGAGSIVNDQVLAPLTAIGGSGAVKTTVDPSLRVPSVTPLPAGNEPGGVGSITGTSVLPPQAGPVASAGALPNAAMDPNANKKEPSQTLAATGQGVATTNPTAPSVLGNQTAAGVIAVQGGESGALIPNPPTTQYGQSAP